MSTTRQRMKPTLEIAISAQATGKSPEPTGWKASPTSGANFNVGWHRGHSWPPDSSRHASPIFGPALSRSADVSRLGRIRADIVVRATRVSVEFIPAVHSRIRKHSNNSTKGTIQ